MGFSAAVAAAASVYVVVVGWQNHFVLVSLAPFIVGNTTL